MLLVDGSLAPTQDRSVAEQSKTSHVAGRSSRCSGSTIHGRREGVIGIEQNAALQAVVEAAEQFAEQIPESGGMAFSTSAPPVIVGAWSLGAESREGAHTPG